MPNNLENAVCIPDFDTLLNSNNLLYKRIYYGSEFCENLIPKKEEVIKTVKFLDKRGIALTFFTPFCTDYGISRLNKVIPVLPDGTEIVLNDFGTLRLLKNVKRKTFNLIWGRLLVKHKRDPRICHLRVSNKVGEFLKTSNINDKDFQAFLLDEGIKRIEIDNSCQGYNYRLNKSISVSLYYPYVYITTTTKCIFRENANLSACKLDCEKNIMISRVNGLPGSIITQGNTEFYQNNLLPDRAQLNRLNIDRIVYLPEMPGH
jgi:hypothetical protein